MTPAKLHALADVDAYARHQAESGPAPRPAPSTNPAADLMSLASM